MKKQIQRKTNKQTTNYIDLVAKTAFRHSTQQQLFSFVSHLRARYNTKELLYYFEAKKAFLF